MRRTAIDAAGPSSPDKPQRRRRMWLNMARFEACLPALEESRPRLDGWMLMGCGLLPFVLVPLTVFFSLRIGLGGVGTATVVVVPVLAVLLLGPRASFKLFHRLPPDLRTVGDLARAITLNGSVFETIRFVIADECGVEAQSITADTDLAKNLGI